jgi:hypothetical protein
LGIMGGKLLHKFIPRDDFRTALKKYIEIIDQRDQLILAAIDEPTS